ncbi:hypothetical protein D8B26_007417 [Coccidioides posadasii str. Silveira]|uniref:uncharacterized protein n=1 Tax=Coccidioides posadasii (strain RMSCC 757 / Silveira) TaxID=443226 RepID=UPI001BEFE654|nr:hypothetical protein D8B26_007417 [Coccidioides posadasii str. Silveira]
MSFKDSSVFTRPSSEYTGVYEKAPPVRAHRVKLLIIGIISGVVIGTALGIGVGVGLSERK